MSDDEQPSAFSSADEEIQYWKSKARSWKSVADEREDVVINTQAEMQDFMESSKELEKEMDREISASNRKISDLQTKTEALRGEKDEWKTKYQKSLAEHNSALAIMQREVGQMRDSHEAFKNKLRDMELDNDELENAERMVASSLVDMESKYNRAIERTALLEEELVEKSRLEDELQRLRDEVRDLQEELSVRSDVASRQVDSRSVTPAEAASSGRQSALDLRLEDLILDRARPQSSGRAKPAELSASRHERRGSLNMRLTDRSGAPPNSDSSSYADRRTAIRRDTASSATSPRTRGTGPRTTVRSLAPRPAAVGSMKLMANLIARMQTVEGKLQSARVINKVPDADKSSIPRPSSRLGQSTGPGGVNSPGLPRVTSRQSFDGRSSIPVPANGFSKSTTRRPSSRMSNAAGSLTPPSSNATLPASRRTPPRHRMSSPSSPPHPPPSRVSSDLQHDTSLASHTLPRRSSVSSGIARPRVSGIATAVGRSSNSSVPPGTGTSAKLGSSTAHAGPPTGPPNSWRTTIAARPRSSTIGSKSSK